MTQNGLFEQAKYLMDELLELEKEVRLVLPYTKTLWATSRRHFPYTTYGFTMCLFSKLDLFSQYWFPTETDQTKKMVSFLGEYLNYSEKESEIAVQLWRHKLMHTSEPRILTEAITGKRYGWLLQHELDVEKHWRFQGNADPRILSVGVLNLASDLRSGLKRAIECLSQRQDLVTAWLSVTERLGIFKEKY